MHYPIYEITHDYHLLRQLRNASYLGQATDNTNLKQDFMI